ncbi:hypothetical protein FB390_0175 [Nocardia bhagyanarayanae]|uniref:Uncharacterized protein n=1 Tax=Nocardia bhagyanarayanae TaxID=1215925 RepID=A0A543F444_9NOCA|nr:hypothetical protein FB390_0175 [Nocardia bhagyanarayanae]
MSDRPERLSLAEADSAPPGTAKAATIFGMVAAFVVRPGDPEVSG